MSREKPTYRDTLDLLLQKTNGAAVIRLSAAADLLGVDAKALTNVPTMQAGRFRLVSVATLARMLS